jgi:hypothetical protein
MACAAALTAAAAADREAPLPDGYWDEASAEAILSKTLTVRLAPDLSELTAGEKSAVEHLIEAGKIFQDLYELQLHPQALEARAALEALGERSGSSPRTAKLIDLYRLSKGPVTTTLDNRRVAFLPVADERPGKNVYPLDITRDEMEAWIEDHPERKDHLLHSRGIVRRATLENLEADLKTLTKHPVLDTLHPGRRETYEWLSRRVSRSTLYAVPYSIAWPERILAIYGHLNAAADAVAGEDPDFARFLRLRGRDLLADDYDGGDGSWVTGSFVNLNAQIGSYETYDDALYGVKSFFSLAVMKRDRARSDALREAVAGLQEIEDTLPYEAHKRIREGIPIGVYDVVADFGQSRGANSATILPNESHLARQHGRTILLRSNILLNPELFEVSASAYRAAVPPDQAGDYTPEGNLQRILWHEIGHYLGVDRTADGRELDAGLQDASDLYEEMKSDLVSLFAVPALSKKGYYDERTARSVYAGGILRVIQKTKPRRDQPYQTMQLMQWNWYLENGLLDFDPVKGTMRIHYALYPQAVESLLREVLAIQRAGDREKAEAFVKRWTSWREDLHEIVAGRVRESESSRFTLIRYAALGE